MSQQALMKSDLISTTSMLYEYQKDVLNGAKANWLYALDTGTGKTILSLHHYLKYSNGEPLLIVAPPQKIAEGGWDRDIQTVVDHYNIEIGYDLLSYGKIATDWKKYKGWFVIFDECHYVKNPTSKRGKAAAWLAKVSTNFVLLSATPSSNGWSDTINYFIMFGLAQNKTQFEREYAQFDTMFLGKRRINKVVGWNREAALKKMYQGFSVKLSKEDCLDLPGMVIEDVLFRRSTEYLKLKKDRILDVDGEKVIYDTYPKLAIGLRYYANQTDKLKYLEMLAEGTEENLIVFYNFKGEKEMLLELCKKLKKKVYEVSGQKSELAKRDIWFGLKNSVTLVQYQAGAAGIELQYANLVVFYTPTYSLQDYEQSLGRAYRNGQTKKVTVYHFVSQNTIEEAIYASLRNKKDFTDDLFAKYLEG